MSMLDGADEEALVADIESRLEELLNADDVADVGELSTGICGYDGL